MNNPIYPMEPMDSTTDPRSPAYNGRRTVGQECCCLMLVADGIIETAKMMKCFAENGDARGAFLTLASLQEDVNCITKANILDMMDCSE